jgi:hypothetical protein
MVRIYVVRGFVFHLTPVTKSCTRPVKLIIQRLQENDHLEVNLLRSIEGNIGNCGNWDMRNEDTSLQDDAPSFLSRSIEIRPEDGLPASYYNVTY